MIDRRRVLEGGILTLAAAGLGLAPASSSAPEPEPLRRASRATGEQIALTPAQFTEAAWSRMAWLLRDPVTGEHEPIDPRLIAALVALAAVLGVPPRYEVLCGFRSPDRRRGATGGYHALGRALDVRLEGVSSRRLAVAAAASLRGGVGHYRNADFVHLDTGAPRRWAG
jgi:uncharacterized protein YcbK (DUF882 family)